MSTKKELLQEANQKLANYVDSSYTGNYVGEFSENGTVSLSLDGNFELTELADIVDIAQRYKLLERKTV